jgi:hypothetical protein
MEKVLLLYLYSNPSLHDVPFTRHSMKFHLDFYKVQYEPKLNSNDLWCEHHAKFSSFKHRLFYRLS